MRAGERLGRGCARLGGVVGLAELVADDVGPHVGRAQSGAAVHPVVGLPGYASDAIIGDANARGNERLTGILIRGAVAGIPPCSRSCRLMVLPFFTPKLANFLDTWK